MSFGKTKIAKPDGRNLWFYWWEQEPQVLDATARSTQLDTRGLELRWNPLLDEWVIVAPVRQDRTFLPKRAACPLCPSRSSATLTEVPSKAYEIAVFENRFPSFRQDAPKPAGGANTERRARASGASEVVVYGPRHDLTLAEMPTERVVRLIDVWADRYRDLATRKDVHYVYIFENRGKEIGVTLTHPHGQIYAFPFIPPRIDRELGAASKYKRERGRCLHCDLIESEQRASSRIVATNEEFVAFVPFFARLPYEVHIVSCRHRSSLVELSPDERGALARMMKIVLKKYDNLWGFPLPLTMAMHQKPTDGRRHPGCHFYIEFAPLHRSANKLKYMAGCETGAGTFINDSRPEETSVELRKAKPRT